MRPREKITWGSWESLAKRLEVYTHLYIYVYVHIHIFIYTHTDACIHIYIHTYLVGLVGVASLPAYSRSDPSFLSLYERRSFQESSRVPLKGSRVDVRSYSQDFW